MKLFNTLTREIEELEPIEPPEVKVYTCGPTVYDYPHIGNWFTFIRYDLLIRTLKESGFKPKWVLNITDVGHLVSDADEGEDKLETGAAREGKTAWEIANFYTNYFIDGLKRLNFTKPDYLPRATEHIEEQIELVKKLEHKGYTYRIDDGIYYDTSKFPKYAEFAILDLDEQQAGPRVSYNPQKRQPSDFALWKFSPKDHRRDMEWDSPWGKGFPGWHLECSAMVLKYLGETIDIHSGGIDHIPVHHTNEIAQSEAISGRPLAKFWMHTNHILLGDRKIAKSKGGGVTLEDIEARGFSLASFRLLVMQSHYRTQSKFSWDELEAAQARLKTIQDYADLRFQPASPEAPEIPTRDYAAVSEQIRSMMCNDLNTPLALRFLNEAIDKRSQPINHSQTEEFTDFIRGIDGLFGLNLLSSKDITDEQKALIAKRQQLRESDDWQKADELRQQLANQGIDLNDTPYGPVWSKAAESNRQS